MYDFLFELTEHSDNEGEQILVECETLQQAFKILENYGFQTNEIRFVTRLSVEEGEILGLDTY
mgnify:FL=1